MADDNAVDVRRAGREDLDRLSEIETAAMTLLEPVVDTSGWPQAPSGQRRVADGGWILVAGEPAGGFAHVMDTNTGHHVQLAVHPDHARQGYGSALLKTAVQLVKSHGGNLVTVTAFPDAPWNEALYRGLGFTEIDEQPAAQSGVRRSILGVNVESSAPVIPAVSVIPLRQGPDGIEVFVQHRVATMDFAAGFIVFPGGRIDPVDLEAQLALTDEAIDDLVDAWRESGYVIRSEDKRKAVQVLMATGIREMEEETGVRLLPNELLPWDDWTTPPQSPKRFNAHFLVAHLPRGDERAPSNTTTEARVSEWITVSELLAQGDRGEVMIMAPTRVILEEINDFKTMDGILAAHPVIQAVHLDKSGVRPRPSRRSS